MRVNKVNIYKDIELENLKLFLSTYENLIFRTNVARFLKNSFILED